MTPSEPSTECSVCVQKDLLLFPPTTWLAQASPPLDFERTAHRSFGQNRWSSIRAPVTVDAQKRSENGQCHQECLCPKGLKNLTTHLKQPPTALRRKAHQRCLLWPFLHPLSRYKTPPCPHCDPHSQPYQVSSLPHTVSLEGSGPSQAKHCPG